MRSALLENQRQFQPGTDLLHVENTGNQEQIRAFARRRFREAYGADVKDFLPNMLALLNSDMQVTASLGYQRAADHALYLEQYLEQPVEHVIADTLRISPPHRQEILEIGNLASRSSGATRRLILQLAIYLRSQGYKWLVITATAQVHNSFEKLGVSMNLHRLGDARQSSVAKGQSDWGDYYQNDPAVFAVDMESAITTLMSNLMIARLISQTQPPITDTGIRIGKKRAVK